jgi:hypothetical protein
MGKGIEVWFRFEKFGWHQRALGKVRVLWDTVSTIEYKTSKLYHIFLDDNLVLGYHQHNNTV